MAKLGEQPVTVRARLYRYDNADDKGHVYLELRDDASSTLFLEVAFEVGEAADFIMGRGAGKGVGILRNADIVGKKRDAKIMKVAKPSNEELPSPGDTQAYQEAIKARADKKLQDDLYAKHGWHISSYGFNARQNDREMHAVTIARYVGPTEEALQELVQTIKDRI